MNAWRSWYTIWVITVPLARRVGASKDRGPDGIAVTQDGVKRRQESLWQLGMKEWHVMRREVVPPEGIDEKDQRPLVLAVSVGARNIGGASSTRCLDSTAWPLHLAISETRMLH